MKYTQDNKTDATTIFFDDEEERKYIAGFIEDYLNKYVAEMHRFDTSVRVYHPGQFELRSFDDALTLLKRGFGV